MKMVGMGHVGINAGNFEKSLCFYRDLLGLQQENTVDMGEFSLTNLRMPDGGLLELFNYGARTDRAQADNSAVGYRHFAFLVEDVDAWHARLVENGVEIRMAPENMPAIGTRGMLCLDPDGTEVELYQPL